MFYVSDGKVYVREGDHFRNVGFTAKDKVITRRELESTSVVMGTVVVDTLDNPVVLTREEIITKSICPRKIPFPLSRSPARSPKNPLNDRRWKA